MSELVKDECGPIGLGAFCIQGLCGHWSFSENRCTFYDVQNSYKNNIGNTAGDIDE